MDDARAQKFLITGAGGMIGAAFKSGIKLTRKDLDVTNQNEVMKKIASHRPTAIIHLANIDLRQCEKDPLLAVRTNIHSTQYIIDSARALEIPLLFVSSGSIFNGPVGSVNDENATPEPLNIYGEAKVISEEMILRQYPKLGVVIRTGWVFGGHGAHHLKFVDQVIDKIRKNETIYAGQDNQGSPTYVEDLVHEMTRLALGTRGGIFHIVNKGPATPRDMVNFIAETMGASPKIEVYRPTGAEAEFRRSSCEVLASRHIQLRTWQEALKEYVQLKMQR